MRLPWLQVNADGMTRARLLGRLLGVHEHHGVGLAMTLWAWALEMSPEGDFAGNVPGDAELIAAALSWPIGDAARLITQLQKVGLITTAPTLRVRGLSRYRRTWEKNRRNRFSELNQPESRGRVPGSGANPARKTETDTKTTPAIDARRTPLIAELMAIYTAETGAQYAFAANGERNAAAVSRLLSGVEPDVAVDAWRSALRSNAAPLVRSLWELAATMEVKT